MKLLFERAFDEAKELAPKERAMFFFLATSDAHKALCNLADTGQRGALMAVALLARDLTTRLQDMLKAEANLPALREIAEMMPDWPMLVAPHGDANNHFPLSLARLMLGGKCPIRVGESNQKKRIKYSLQTPVNRFVWEIIHRHDSLRLLLKSCKKMNMGQEVLEGILENCGFTKESLTLPKPGQGDIKSLADQVIMPYIKAKYPDARKIPCFAKLDSGPTGQRYSAIRTAVIKSLNNMIYIA